MPFRPRGIDGWGTSGRDRRRTSGRREEMSWPGCGRRAGRPRSNNPWPPRDQRGGVAVRRCAQSHRCGRWRYCSWLASHAWLGTPTCCSVEARRWAEISCPSPAGLTAVEVSRSVPGQAISTVQHAQVVVVRMVLHHQHDDVSYLGKTVLADGEIGARRREAGPLAFRGRSAAQGRVKALNHVCCVQDHRGEFV